MNYKEKVIALLDSKELSQEQKEKLESIFPELKESKDDYEELLDFLKSASKTPFINYRNKFKRWIAWIEKQNKKDEEILVLKDQIESLHAAIKALKEAHKIELEKQGEQKPADIIPQDFEKYVEHLLSLSDGEGHGSPAKVKEVSAELLKLAKLEQKSAWSEEDEEALEVAIIALKDMYSENSPFDCYAGHPMPFDKAANQLESLKDRVQPQKERSEEDTEILKWIFAHIETNDLKMLEKVSNWLKYITQIK